jgi:hypothetical protein
LSAGAGAAEAPCERGADGATATGAADRPSRADADACIARAALAESGFIDAAASRSCVSSRRAPSKRRVQ